MPAGDLCTLNDVQGYLATPSASTAPVLAFLVTSVSAWVQGFCQRRFDGVHYLDWTTDGKGGDTLTLPERPVLAVTSITIDGHAVSGWAADDSSVTLRGGRFLRGRKNIRIAYSAGFPYQFTPGTPEQAGPPLVPAVPDTITGVPGDLRWAVVETVALRFRRRDSLGKNSDGMAGQSTSYDNAIAPKDAMAIFNKYKKNVPW